MMALLTILVTLLLGQVDIARENRVFNRSGSQCVWSSLETIGRHFGIRELYDLTDWHKGTSGPEEVNLVLSAKHLPKWYWHPEGKQDWESLHNAIIQHWPVAVGLNGTHMLLVVDESKDTIKVIDNCGPKALEIQEWNKEKFRRIWDGWFVCIPGRKPTTWSNALWLAGE